ncbi:MAG: DUF5067 domain-containing protein [Clostridiales bacterium]|nr:DUF5067 domain-containing protein [Clostridiales bacterium]
MKHHNILNQSHKKLLLGVISTLLILTAVAGCSSSVQTSPQQSSQQSASPEPAAKEDTEAAGESGALGDYEISILDAVKTTDFEGNPAIVINFDFQNNSSNNAMFSTAVLCQAYQDGVSLSSAIIINNDVYDGEASLKTLQPGAKLRVQKAYTLTSADAPVTVEVKPLISFGDDKLTKTFTM